MLVTYIGRPLDVRERTCNISRNRWLRMSMCIIVGIILIPIMLVIYYERIQMVSSCLTRSLRCLCLIPLIRPTSTAFRYLSLLVTL